GSATEQRPQPATQCWFGHAPRVKKLSPDVNPASPERLVAPTSPRFCVLLSGRLLLVPADSAIRAGWSEVARLKHSAQPSAHDKRSGESGSAATTPPHRPGTRSSRAIPGSCRLR